MSHFMLDLETLGIRPGCVISAIGCVHFNSKGVLDSFYTRVSIQSCLKHGLTMDADTVLWWMSQQPEARAELCRSNGNNPLVECHELTAALTLLAEWLATCESDLNERQVWGNGASFDNPILTAAYKACGWEAPWKFWNDRCYRTVKSMHPEIELERSGVHHLALDDARSQALHLIRLPSWQYFS